MRALRTGLVGIFLALSVSCTVRPPAAVPGSGVSSGSAPTASSVATATTAPAATETPAGAPAAEDKPLAVGGQLMTALVIVPGSPVRYGLLGAGLARSDDAGQSWRRVSDLSLPIPLVSNQDPNTLYAGNMPSCYKDEETPAFRRSTDGGSTWEEVSAGRGIRPVAIVAGATGGPATIYGISCAGLNLSRDGGDAWQVTGRTMGWDITSILPMLDGNVRFLAVLTSEGGTSHLAWFNGEGALEQDLTDGLSFWALGVLARAGGIFYLADSMGVRRLNETTGRWDLFASGLEDVVLKTDPMTAGLSEEDAARGFGLLALAPDPADPRRLALGTVRGLYLSQDGGEHWRKAGSEALEDMRVNSVAWDAAAPGTLYATTPAGIFAVRLPA